MKAGLTDTEAQEVVQETVISVAKKMNALKYDPALGSFKGWLLHLTRWRIADQWRKRRGDVSPPKRASDDTARTATVERQPDPASLDLDAVWEQEWQKNLMDAALQRTKRKVGAKQYKMFDLYVLKGWPVEDVVKTLKVSADSVYQARTRVTAVIKNEVEQLEGSMI